VWEVKASYRDGLVTFFVQNEVLFISVWFSAFLLKERKLQIKDVLFYLSIAFVGNIEIGFVFTKINFILVFVISASISLWGASLIYYKDFLFEQKLESSSIIDAITIYLEVFEMIYFAVRRAIKALKERKSQKKEKSDNVGYNKLKEQAAAEEGANKQ